MHITKNSGINRIIGLFLNPISLVFKTISFFNLRRKLLVQKKYDQAFIISVNNLSFGGTGKTSLVLEIGRQFEAKGINFSVITRGYRSRFETSGLRILEHHTVADVGDEARLFKDNFPNRDIYIGGNRHLSINNSLKKGNKIIILDDGFQSTDISKNISIMLLNPNHPYYYLRNFKFMAKTEDYILSFSEIKEGAESENSARYWFEPQGFLNCDGDTVRVKNAPIYGFSALGDNIRFKNDLAHYNLINFRSYPDHYHFTQAAIEDLNRGRLETKSDFLACTEKDFVKIRELKIDHIPLIYLQNRIKFNFPLIEKIVSHAEKKGYI